MKGNVVNEMLQPAYLWSAIERQKKILFWEEAIHGEKGLSNIMATTTSLQQVQVLQLQTATTKFVTTTFGL